MLSKEVRVKPIRLELAVRATLAVSPAGFGWIAPRVPSPDKNCSLVAISVWVVPVVGSLVFVPLLETLWFSLCLKSSWSVKAII